ncbi:MAG: hypothetical protein H6662_19135 [Ardenticatenaceae bacterium]|nr:hypothetical protein [Anaerolineales bacterium]MCB8923707.1 hypothetical protein [Ardenticatenaceae bacterium]
MNEEIDSLKEAEKEIFENDIATDTKQRPLQRHHHSDGNLVAGVVLVAVGGIFLLTNLTGLTINNWWALFILIPAFSNFKRVWRGYQANGRLTHSTRGSLTGGFILTLVASVFLFDVMTWDIVWPIFLIILGINALLGSWFD